MAFVARDAALASALSDALALIKETSGRDRRAVAAELGVDVSAVGRWATGERSVPIEHLPAIDAMCGQPKGYVLRLAGYVEPVDIEAAIAGDPNLTESNRHAVALYYRFARDELKEGF